MSIRYFLFFSWLSAKGSNMESTLHVHALTPPGGSFSVVSEYISCSVNHFTDFLSTYRTQSPSVDTKFLWAGEDMPESRRIICTLCYFCTISTNAERNTFLHVQDERRSDCPSAHSPGRLRGCNQCSLSQAVRKHSLLQANH